MLYWNTKVFVDETSSFVVVDVVVVGGNCLLTNIAFMCSSEGEDDSV